MEFAGFDQVQPMIPPTDGPARSCAEEASAIPPVKTWHLAMVASVAVAAFAVALRARMMMVGRSLWLDEAALALNICGRSFSGLLGPLDLDQAAPVGFLLIERAAVMVCGPGELSLRLFPFLASLATLILVHRFCAMNLGRGSAFVVIALAGVMPALVYYSGELKQYSSDVASGLLILVLAASSLRNGLTARRATALAASGTAVVWLSHPSVFILGGAGATLILDAVIGRRYRLAALAAAVSGCWLASFAVEYHFFLKDLHANQDLVDYWESAFLKFPPTSPNDLRLYPAVGFGVFESLFHNGQADVDLSMRMGVFMAAAWMIGVVTLYRQGRRRVLALLVTPLALAVLASMLHRYPLKSRLALFTAASTLPTIAAGLGGLVTTRNVLDRAIGGILLSCALLLPVMQGAQFLIERPRLHDARSVLARVSQSWRPGDVVVVDRFSSPQFLYYQRFGRVSGLDRLAASATELTLTEPDELAREVGRWKGCRRVWFLLEAAVPDPINPSRGALKVILDQGGEVIESASCRRYSAHLYRLDGDLIARGRPKNCPDGDGGG